jgi:4-hydroxy-tetrahydrodipicolinate reductase
MTVRVGVFGATGRMGATVCEAVAGDDECDLVAAVDPAGAGTPIADLARADVEGHVTADPSGMVEAGVEVAVDFTTADAGRDNLLFLADAGIHAVVGTTGFSDDDLAEFRAAFTQSNCVIAPNFAIGAVLLMKFAADAAPYFDTAEVIELHHDGKVDAPSGTAALTAQRMAEASSEWGDDPTAQTLYEGARGGVAPGGIRIHSVRMRGMVAHQEVILGTTGQTVTIRHDSIDRTSFMPGVLLAVKAIADHPGLTIGLDPFLNL